MATARDEVMTVHAGIAKVAALLADPARETILAALADGRALPAGELAAAAGVSPQSASLHLRRLVEGGIVSVWQQGRFRYFRLADEHVVAALEALAVVAARPPPSAQRAPEAAARSCYNHLAGRLGVALADGLQRRGYLRIGGDAVALTSAGRGWAEAAGFVAAGQRIGRPELRLCLDWTERRFHLAGSVPNALLGQLLEAGHLARGGKRALVVTASGKTWLAELGVAA
jgi:DNA-binding transcriptional ArsR family regulator